MFLVSVLALSVALPSWAQSWQGSGAPGEQKHSSAPTDQQAWQDFTPGYIPMVQGQTFTTGSQTFNAGGFSNPGDTLNAPDLPPTMTTQYGGIIEGSASAVGLDELPPTRLSSFVADSGFDEAIYGDEGTTGLPPINGFEYENTIGAGLESNQDLTTGHQSALPSAWLWTGDPGGMGGTGGRKRDARANPGGVNPAQTLPPARRPQSVSSDGQEGSHPGNSGVSQQQTGGTPKPAGTDYDMTNYWKENGKPLPGGIKAKGL